LVVAGWIGAAGDQSPHPIYRKEALNRMMELSEKSRLEDIAERIVDVVKWVYEVVEKERNGSVPLVHRMERIDLPARKITVDEYVESKRISREAAKEMEKNPAT